MQVIKQHGQNIDIYMSIYNIMADIIYHGIESKGLLPSAKWFCYEIGTVVSYLQTGVNLYMGMLHSL